MGFDGERSFSGAIPQSCVNPNLGSLAAVPVLLAACLKDGLAKNTFFFIVTTSLGLT